MKLLQSLILSCQEASALIQKKEEGKLGAIQGMQLRLHLSICVFCRHYEKQSGRINDFIGQYFEDRKPKENPEFKEELKTKIREKGSA
ncbi:hypothetical protein [Croceimicrobium hydrocarbonivorans]|uniref:Zinc-finger domain-containing protein n=1 Tax=Croceimicrobium hydrocarbonivorans TaxID=2761580 RepID=A0A7H0VIZ6_9FLAO|nr:hypothetical protein [Croceimicrobium hydrocarbonivorans]QNR25694.1 hypothetical protein H4K34_07595 [Croceimicrobium hydrocarbonivorans]